MTAPVAAAVGLSVLLVLIPVSAESMHGEEGAWMQAVGQYMRDTRHGRRGLLQRAAQRTDLSAVDALIVADAALRAGKTALARRLLERVVRDDVGEPMTTYAHLALGWLLLTRGERESARTEFLAVGSGRGPVTGIGVLMTALIDAADGKSVEAAGTLNALARDDGVGPPSIRSAGRLGACYAYYWGDDFATAAVDCKQAATALAGTPLADDARYVAALSALRTGDRNGGIEALQGLKNSVPDAWDGSVSRDLVDLPSTALMRAAKRRSHQVGGPMKPPEDRVMIFLNADARRLAAVKLAQLSAPSGDMREGRSRAGEQPVSAPRRTPAISGEPQEPTAAHGSGSGGYGLIAVLVFGALAAVLLVARFTGHHPGPGGSR